MNEHTYYNKNFIVLIIRVGWYVKLKNNSL